VAHKRLLVQSAAREKILRGASALADAVRVTLGPKSKCVLIEKKRGRPIVCNDGGTIAKELELEDRREAFEDAPRVCWGANASATRGAVRDGGRPVPA
jgi:chaperonin GroEL (HSP60 family)